MLKRKDKLDLSIIITIIIFAGISLVTISSASTYISKTMGNLVLKQSIWYLVGIVFVAIILHFKNNYLYRQAVIIYIICCLSLLLLLFFGSPINNSKCWFVIPGIGSFQPSEFMKIILILTPGVMIHNFKIKYSNPTMKEEFIFLLKTVLIVAVSIVMDFLGILAIPVFLMVGCNIIDYITGLMASKYRE